MALTQGQIESFALICMNQIACQWANYISLVFDGLNDAEQNDEEERFYQINSMWETIWGYDPLAANNCLTADQIREICLQLMSELGLTLVLEDLPDTYLNFPRDFNPYDFNPQDFA
jgi:hypothetical protein